MSLIIIPVGAGDPRSIEKLLSPAITQSKFPLITRQPTSGSACNSTTTTLMNPILSLISLLSLKYL